MRPPSQSPPFCPYVGIKVRKFVGVAQPPLSSVLMRYFGISTVTGEGIIYIYIYYFEKEKAVKEKMLGYLVLSLSQFIWYYSDFDNQMNFSLFLKKMLFFSRKFYIPLNLNFNYFDL